MKGEFNINNAVNVKLSEVNDYHCYDGCLYLKKYDGLLRFYFGFQGDK